MIHVPHNLKFVAACCCCCCLVCIVSSLSTKIDVTQTHKLNQTQKLKRKKKNQVKKERNKRTQQHFIFDSISIGVSRKCKTYKPISSILFVCIGYFLLYYIILFSCAPLSNGFEPISHTTKIIMKYNMRPLNRELMLNPMKNGEIIYFRFLKAQHILSLFGSHARHNSKENTNRANAT